MTLLLTETAKARLTPLSPAIVFHFLIAHFVPKEQINSLREVPHEDTSPPSLPHLSLPTYIPQLKF